MPSTDDPAARLFRPTRPNGTGALVLAGSSGRLDAQRAELLSKHGVLALAIRWFGGPRQQPGPFEVPIELFVQSIDSLASECDRLAVIGTSFGAEAALVTASHDSRIQATIAFAPSSVVWGGWDGRRLTSHWTLEGKPLPYVPFLPDWKPDREPPAFVDLYRSSFAAYRDAAARASIPVDKIAGDVVLIAGGDDQVWPSVEFAEHIVSRRHASDLETILIAEEEAGHRTILPGEDVVEAGIAMSRGGSARADSQLGKRAWPTIATVLRLWDLSESHRASSPEEP